MANISVTIGGFQVPDPDYLINTPAANDADTRTLDGTLYTDFINIIRTWELGWERLAKDSYDELYTLYLEQFQTGIYPILEIPYYGVYAPAKLSINRQNIRFDGACMLDFEITLLEKYAIS